MDPIRHVVLLMLENHSFDQMLGCMQEVYPDLDGVAPGAEPRTNADEQGRIYGQRPVEATQVNPDPKHETKNALDQLADGNGGFIRDYLGTYGEAARAGCDDVMGYFKRGFLPALHVLAEQFTVCDRWFSSLPGPTWPNRFFALSGTSNGRVLMPEKGRQLSMLFTQTQPTIFDRLNARSVSWRTYFYDFPASLILRRQREPHNLKNFRRINRFFADARGDEGAFPSFVFIEPKYFGVDQNDDHPPHNVMKAQKLIADVYDAIRSNPALWQSTLLVVVYDEHGGFYDHVHPPPAVPPDEHREEYSFDRLGFRVPAVLVSPWLSARVESTPFDHTSLLKYLIEKWNLDGLGKRTESATSIGCAFRSMPAAARRDTIPFIRVPNSVLISKKPDLEARNASTHHDGLHLVADILSAGDAALAQAVEAAARVAEIEESALPKVQAMIGDMLVAWGRALRKPLEDAEERRIDKTSRAVDKLIPPDP